MTIVHERVWSRAAAVVATFAMVFVAFVVMVPLAPGQATSRGVTGAAASPHGTSALASTCGQVAVPLASTSTYAALSGTTVTSTGATALTGDLGVSPGSSVTGFPPGTLTGTKNVANASSAQAEADLTVAYDYAAARSNCAVTVAGNIGGQTLTPGLYKSTSTLAVSSGDLTLSGGGDPNGVFVFQVASSFTTTSGRMVILSNGAQAGNVFWQVGSSATIGTTSTVQGTIMTYASITMLSGSHLNGRALARTGDVTLSASTIVVPTVSSPTTYAVSFTEATLPTGTSWSVTFDGVLTTSTTTTVGFTVASGTYAYTVGSVSGYTATPSTGSITVSGADVNQEITFATNGGTGGTSVTFTESGLASGTTWTVTLNGVLSASITATVVFSMAAGTYTYAVGTVPDHAATPATGSVTVGTTAVAQSIAFTVTSGSSGTYSVTFTESGLAPGTSWSVTLNGVLKSSVTSTIVFTETNGSNGYSVGTSTGYTTSPSSGSVMVNGASANQAVTFTSASSGGGGGAGVAPWVWWATIGIVVIGAIAAIGALVMRRRGRRTPKTAA